MLNCRRRWARTKVACLTLVVMFAVAACTSDDDDGGLIAPDGGILEMVWLPDGFYVVIGGDSTHWSTLWRMHEDEGLSQVDLSPAFGCDEPYGFWSVFAVGNRLGVAGKCGLGDDMVVMAVDQDDPIRSELLVTVPVPVSEVEFSSDGRYAYSELKFRDCRMLLRLRPGEPRVLAGEVQEDGVLEFDESGVPLKDLMEEDCVAQESLGWAALSDDGEVMVLARTEGAAGSVARGRRGADSRLYVWQHGGGHAEPFGPMLRGIYSVAVSPDGGLIAVTTTASADRGVWLFDRGTGASRKVAEGRYYELAFSPGGESLAAVHRPISADRNSVAIFDAVV